MIYRDDIRKALYAYFVNNLNLRPYTRGWLKGDCPECSRKDKFGVNIFRNKSNCFVCGYSDKPLDIVKGQENLDSNEQALKFLKGQDYKDDSYYRGFKNLENYESSIVEKVNSKVSLPESYTNILLGSSQYSKSARSYLKSRGFNLTSLAMVGVGYCTRGKYAGYIIFPFYERGELIYFQSRNYLSPMGPKFQNPETSDFGIGKSTLLYNRDALYIYKKAYIVESITNARTLGDNGVAILGKSISINQGSSILRSPVKDLVIILDRDAILKSIEVALMLVPFKRIKTILLETDKDVNDLGKKFIKGLENDTPWANYSDLIKLKHKYESS